MKKHLNILLVLLLTLFLTIFIYTPVFASDSNMEKIEQEDINNPEYNNLLNDFKSNQSSQTPQNINEQEMLQLQRLPIKNSNELKTLNTTTTNPTIYETEPNNSITQANKINLNNYVIGTITNNYYDLDYYKITIAQGCKLKILGLFGDSTYNQYLAIGLRDVNDKSLGWSRLLSTSVGTCQYIEQSISPGIYYVVVMQTSPYKYLLTGELYGFQVYTDNTSTIVPVSSISVLPSSLTFTEGDTSKDVAIAVNPSNATNKNYNWTSTDNTVATMSGSTVVPGKPGAAIIKITPQDGSNCSAQINVTVNAKTSSVRAISLTASTTTPSAGSSVTLTATATGGSATTQYVFWTDIKGEWNIVSNNYSNTYTLNNVQPGTYVAAVFAVDGSNAPVQSNRVYIKVDSSASVQATYANGMITATVTSSNIFNPLYDWWYQDPSGQWTSVYGHFTQNNTMTIDNPVAGTYNIVCNVTDPEFFWSLSENDGQWGSALFAYAQTSVSTQGGTPGTWTDITGNGGFNKPRGIAVDSSGNVYVADYSNNYIKKLVNGTTIWTDITGNGGFNKPWGVAVDSSGNVYVADSWNSKIKKLVNGTTTWKDITGRNLFYDISDPAGIAVDSTGNVYVVDYGDYYNNHIKKLVNGTTTWKDITGNGGFCFPDGLAIDSSGNVYVTDGSGKIKKLASGGSTWTDITGNGDFKGPSGVTVDSLGNVYVADAQNNRIKKLENGTWTDITGNGNFKNPSGIALDISGNVYVTDASNNKVKKRKYSVNPPTVASRGHANWK